MTRTEFLNKVVAPVGRFCIFLTRDKSHHFYNSPQEADEFIEQCVNEGKDVYFGVSTFNEDTRKAEHSAYLKSFFLDLDCGEDKVKDKDGNPLPKPKGYVDQATALAALKQFVKAHSLPKPMVVNSGRGVHAYWPLIDPISYVEWAPIAKGFKRLCLESGLIIDPAVPADAARILRPVGTKNFKDPSNPLDVELWMDAQPITLDAFRANVPVQHEPPKLNRQLDATTRALLGNKVSKFKNIHIKTVNGQGCEQLKAALENPAGVDEPMWRAMLSIAWTCEDRDKAIHVVSKGHEGYDPIKTVQKAEQTQGPYLCATIEDMNPMGCAKCQHKGKISSPIRLGDEVQVATPEQSLFEVVEETAEGVSQVVTHQIPEYPAPYVRGVNGGVYRRQVVDGAVEDFMVYRYDFYITKRLDDPDRGQTVMAMVHMPKDGVKSFSLSLVDAMASDRLRDRLAAHGVIVATPKEWGEIMRYVTTWTNSLQAESEAETSRTQFGWADEGDCFIIGDRELRTGNAIRYSPPSSATISIAPLMKKKGTIKEWKSVVNMYGRPGNEVRAFALFMGFGAPLIRLTPLKGALLNLMSPESGTGKSTIQMAINSIYGLPYDLLLQKTDTINARMHRIGIMNNLPVTIDEITNMTPEAMSELAYAITQGRGKDRMKSQGNELRANNTRWQTIVVSSGNSSIYDKLSSLKASADGEIMRVMEFRVDADTSLSKEESDNVFGKLNDNYGVAGDAYINYLLDNPDAVNALMANVKAKVDTSIHFSSRERFWSAMIVCAIAGGIISRNLGLHDINPMKILRWLQTAVTPMRTEAVTAKSEPIENLGVFLVEHARHTLVIHGKPSTSGLPMAPLKEPYGELLVRWEPDTGMIYISTVHLKKWCVDRQVSYKDLVDDLEAKGICTRGEKKRMSTGTNLPGVTINTLKIDAVKGGFNANIAAPGGEPGND